MNCYKLQKSEQPKKWTIKESKYGINKYFMKNFTYQTRKKQKRQKKTNTRIFRKLKS